MHFSSADFWPGAAAGRTVEEGGIWVEGVPGATRDTRWYGAHRHRPPHQQDPRYGQRGQGWGGSRTVRTQGDAGITGAQWTISMWLCVFIIITVRTQGGGMWNAIIYQILDPPKNKISDISRSQKSDIWLKKIRYQISDPKKINYQISHPLKNQISDIKVPPFHHPHTGRHSNHWNSVNNLYVALCLYNYNGPHTGRRSNHWNSCNV